MLVLCTFLRRKFLNQLNHNGGQAVVEYVLLLVITISMILLFKKSFSNLNDFLDGYIGDYTVCLMEYGELPSLGVSDSDQKKHTGGFGRSCEQKFAGFTFANGRPPVGGSGAAQGATGGANPAKASSDNKNADSSKSDSNNQDSSNKKAHSSKQASPYTAGQINRAGGYGTSDGDLDSGRRKVKVIPADDLQGGARRERYSTTTSKAQDQRNKYKVITGAMADEIEKNSGKNSRTLAARIRSIAVEAENRLGPYKKIFTPPPPGIIKDKSDNNSGFELGNIVRWLIIAAMVLGIVLFFGGQIMNYSNSGE